MDDLDHKIIIRLAKNSRESFRQISKELKVSTDTISEKYKKLVDDGKIKASVKLNITKLGYRAHAWYWLSSQKDTSIVKDELMKIPDVIFIHKALGTNYDFLVVVAVKDFNHLHKMDRIIADLEAVSIVDSAHYALKGPIIEFPIPPLFFK